MRRSPLLAAATRNLENLLYPKLLSSKSGAISIMTCFRRSDRITSPRAAMRAIASDTHCQGSRLSVPPPSDVRLRPVSDV